MATMSVSGVASGMDWDSMIDEIITNAAKPAQVQVSKRQNLTNKKSLFEEMKVTMNSLQSSLTPLKLPSTYKAKQVDIERIDMNGSYKGVLTATVNADAEVNVYDLKVNQLARAQTNRSKQITASSVGSALSDYNLNSGTMYINMAGQKIGIDINSNDSLQTIKSKINNTVKTLDIPVAVTASVVDNRLILRSDNTGLGANSMSETLTYDLNARNTITAFNVSDSDLKNGNFVIRSGSTKYTYGKDYDIVNGNEIRWNQYEPTDNVKLGDSVSATYKIAKGDIYQSTGTYGSKEAGITGLTVDKDNFTLSSRLRIVDDDGYTYTYGTDFTLDDSGNVKWIEDEEATTKEPSSYTVSYTSTETVSHTINGTRPSADDVIISDDFDALTEAYNEIYGTTEIPTVNLTDSNGVLRTYLDPEDRSLFTMTSGDNTYEYGKDYVIRVNDTGDGYTISWAITDDVNSDGTKDINDASTVVTTYTQYKDLSTYGMKEAPADGENYDFKFSKDVETTTTSDTVKSTQTDKSLENIFPGESIDESEYSSITIKSGSTEYTYGTDFTIDEDGNIEWLYTDSDAVIPDHPEEGTGYTLIYDAFSGITSSLTYKDEDTQQLALTLSSGKKLTYEQILSDTGLSETSDDSELAKYFTLTDEDGNEYVYGTDYRIISDADSDSDSDSEKEHSTLIEWLSVPAIETGFTLWYTGRSEDTLDLSLTRSNTDAIMTGTSGASPLYSYFDGGTSTITSGTKTFYEGVDYEITSYTTTDNNGKEIKNAAVEWKTGTNSEWYYPGSNASYTINLTDSNGNSISFSGVRNSYDNINLSDYGFTTANGSISSVSFTGGNGTYTYDLTAKAAEDTDTEDVETEDTDTEDTDTEDTETTEDSRTPAQKMAGEIGLAITANSGTNSFNFNWVVPDRTANADLPKLGDEITAEYTYKANTFTLSDDSDGSLLAALELDRTDSAHYTAAQDAELVLDGETITRESNDIGEAYDNELIKGMTIHLKGTGEVSLDVSHDAEKAVESIQTFVDTYNDLMTWMNTRMTESQVDENTKATIDSDDFRMRWGLLHGNSLLRNTKARMRSITSQNFTFSFTQRTSSEEVYGTMGYNGLKNDATLRLRINSKFVDVSILPTDTLQDIIDKINDDSEDGAMHDIYYDDEGKKLTQPLLKASIENDRLVITSTGSDTITMSGTSAMNALKMNYTYKGLYQLGIATTSTDYGKSGELEFDTSKFMEALEDNPDEVQELMLMFANDFDSWTKSMLNASASGETSGTLTREIENLDNQIKTIDEYLERYQERLDRQEESLRTRYANSETQFAKLSQQAASIAAILNQLNGYTNNNNSSSNS